MSETSLQRPPSYGAIFQTGDFVQRGDILGLSVDGKTAVKAPMSGWVRIVSPENQDQILPPIIVEIWRLPNYTGENYALHIAS